MTTETEVTPLGQLHSYPKVYNIGHRQIRDLLDGPVVVQEKVDGSQFSFGRRGDQLWMRSKGRTINGAPDADKLFRPAAELAERLFAEGLLAEGFTYRGEAIASPRHNVLTYSRAPKGGFILFDIDTAEGLECRIPDPGTLESVAAEFGIECVPTLFVGQVENLTQLEELLDRESCLGGPKVEGVVIKNYARFGIDGKMLMGKIVSADFRELHKKEWGISNPGRKDIVEHIKATYRHERRWEKAIQHLREAGLLEDSPRDIGPLIQEIQRDVQEECSDEIKEALYAHFWPEIKRGITAGAAEWYKRQLMEVQGFTDEQVDEPAATAA